MTSVEMTSVEVTVVRVYLTEAEAHLQTLLKRLNDWGKVRGVTVFRGIAGFGKSGTIHSSSLIDLSLDLPVVIEFFDEPDKAGEMIDYLYQVVGPGHIVSWSATLNVAKNEK
jgi:hypothetical protein